MNPETQNQNLMPEKSYKGMDIKKYLEIPEIFSDEFLNLANILKLKY